MGEDGQGVLEEPRLARALEVLLAGRDQRPGKPQDPSVPTPTGALAWARVSADTRKGRELSIPEQLRQIRVYAAQQGYTIAGEYCEVASAFRHDERRTEFHRMVREAKSAPGIRAIIVHDYSRFSRSSLRARVLLRELKEAGVEVISVTEPPFPAEGPMGVFMEAITFAKNEAYSRELSFHVRKGNRANIQTRDLETGWCYKNGGPPLWGYRGMAVQRGMLGSTPIMKRLWTLDGTVVSGRPVHEWVRHCLVELVGEGATPAELSEFCAGLGLGRSRGGSWSRHSWRDLLLPSALLQYCGYGLWGTGSGHCRLRPVEEWAIVEAAHPQIISLQEAHRAAVVSRGPNSRRLHTGYASPRSAPYLVSGGLFRCGICGHMMTVRGHDDYGCPARERRGKTDCQYQWSSRVSCEPVDSRIVQGLQALLRVLTEQPERLVQINGELIASRAAAIARRAPSASGCGHPGSLRGDQTLFPSAEDDPLLQLVELVGPPSVHIPRFQHSAARAVEILASGTPAQRKGVAVGWVERVEIRPGTRRLVAWYRLPEQVTEPAGVGGWCGQHSRSLARLLRRQWTLPAEAFVISY